MAMVILISIAAFAATMLGGVFALRFKDKLHLILGFSAGAVIGVAFFDLLPESLELGGSTTLVALGFTVYLILDRFIVLHHDHEQNGGHGHRGTLGAGSLSFHSFLDGLAIGLAFQVSTVIGATVAIAVLTHDFSDGINTVNLILRNGGSWQTAFKWLLVDAAAPVFGVFSTLFFSIPESALGLVLAVFTGTFLYLSASDLIPESHHRHPRALTTIMTLLGALTIYVIVQLI